MIYWNNMSSLYFYIFCHASFLLGFKKVETKPTRECLFYFKHTCLFYQTKSWSYIWRILSCEQAEYWNFSLPSDEGVKAHLALWSQWRGNVLYIKNVLQIYLKYSQRTEYGNSAGTSLVVAMSTWKSSFPHLWPKLALTGFQQWVRVVASICV